MFFLLFMRYALALLFMRYALAGCTNFQGAGVVDHQLVVDPALLAQLVRHEYMPAIRGACLDADFHGLGQVAWLIRPDAEGRA